jgi:hypothetical protein
MKPGCDLLKLRRGLYGTKQGARLWAEALKARLEKDGYIESPSAKCLFVRPAVSKNEDPSIIFVHVDDGVILCKDKEYITKILKDVNSTYPLTKGALNWYLGLKVEENKDYMKISIPSYILKLAEQFGMDTKTNPKATPCAPGARLLPNKEAKYNYCPYQQAVGAILWASGNCRPDVTYAVNALSRHNNNPGESHWRAVLRAISYLKSTKTKV